MTEQDPKDSLLQTIATLEAKLDFVLDSILVKPDKSKYMTAQEIQKEYGISHRTILNRSNFLPGHKKYIPSFQTGPRRKYFERTVIERLFKQNE
ncbi:hypothetical protein [Fodinibius sp. Rm-B-1B1-1]|jgi:hypothetical protein|uniref:hypothetical protein n=1 Tax=Fodinibius alkaliphilus TaxID=3140241 RepID=UPI00315A166E